MARQNAGPTRLSAFARAELRRVISDPAVRGATPDPRNSLLVLLSFLLGRQKSPFLSQLDT